MHTLPSLGRNDQFGRYLAFSEKKRGSEAVKNGSKFKRPDK